MPEVAITLKLKADEFQTLREELQAHKTTLLGEAKAHRKSRALGQERACQQRAARVSFILEKLG